MVFFYKISIYAYIIAIHFALIFNKKASLMISGRKNWRKILKQKIDKNNLYIWIHCASLGEFEQGRPLIEKLKKEKPEYKIILTFFSPSGYEIRKNYKHADIICYLPFDTKRNAKDFIEIINPEFAVFVKYEFWYYMIRNLQYSNIPFFLISGIFRKNQIFFKTYGKFYLNALKKFSYLFLQDENSKELLNNFDIKNIEVCGDTRIDRVVEISKQKYSNEIFESFSFNRNTIVCGSTWPEDEKIILQYINHPNNNYKLIIAPHEVNEKNIKNIENNINKTTKRYSKIKNIDDLHNVSVIIVDSIGLLSKLYRYGKVSYIGGGFGKGIHNTLEAVVYNIPVIFGPNYKKFKEARDLINIKSAFSISNYIEFKSVIDEIISNNNRLNQIKDNTQNYILNSFGATEHIFKRIEKIIQSLK